MRALLQRVSQCTVIIEDEEYSRISKGLLILLGIEEEDDREDIEWLAGKISRLRIFNDENQVMNLSVTDISGEIMVVSQFTLHASTRKGNRPSYSKAARPETAVPLYESFVNQIGSLCKVLPRTGIFGAHMEVSLVNDGPVTIFIDTKFRE